MQVILCDRCGNKTQFPEVLEGAYVCFSGRGCVSMMLVEGKDLCLPCRKEVAEKLDKEVKNIFNLGRTV